MEAVRDFIPFGDDGQGTGPALASGVDVALAALRAAGATAEEAASWDFRAASDFAGRVEELSRWVEYQQLVAAAAVDRTRTQHTAAAGTAATSWTTGWREETSGSGPGAGAAQSGAAESGTAGSGPGAGAGAGSGAGGISVPAVAGSDGTGGVAGSVPAASPGDPGGPGSVDDGYRNTVEFLRARLLIGAGEARRRLALARCVLPGQGLAGQPVPPVHEELGTALAAGEVASRAASVITAALGRVRPLCDAEALALMEHALTRTAAENDADVLTRVARGWTDALDQDGAEPSEELLRQLQGAFIRRRRHGLHHLEIFATTDQYEHLLTVMNTATNPRTGTGSTETSATTDTGEDNGTPSGPGAAPGWNPVAGVAGRKESTDAAFAEEPAPVPGFGWGATSQAAAGWGAAAETAEWTAIGWGSAAGAGRTEESARDSRDEAVPASGFGWGATSQAAAGWGSATASGEGSSASTATGCHTGGDTAVPACDSRAAVVTGTNVPAAPAPHGHPMPERPTAPNDHPGPAEDPGAAGLDLRSRPQRLLDGLVGACKAALAAGTLPATGGLRPQVMVTIDYRDLLTRLGTTPDTGAAAAPGPANPQTPTPPAAAGSDTDPAARTRRHTGAIQETGSLLFTGPVTARTVRKIACDADILPVLLGSQGQILDIGRTSRIFPPHIRKALIARDQGCTFPGCTIPAAWCEAHHIHYWSRGGPTATDNGTLLCSHHHHVIHKEHWTIHLKNGTPWFIPPPHLDPTQQPRRNHYFKPAHLTTAA